MADQAPTTDPGTEPGATTTTPETDVEKAAFLERLNKESAKRKDAEKRASDIEKQLADLRTQLEERDNAGLPELERERKQREQLEKRIEEAEKRAQEADERVTMTERKSLVLAAASKAGFDDPADATRFPEIVNLSEIEDADQAERAVKKLAKAKPRLLKDEEPQLPGRVLADGRTPAPAGKKGGIDLDDEAQMIAQNLQQFLKNRAKA